jgi:hypothetical protein
MSRPSRLARLLWLGSALLQLLLPGAAAWADAREDLPATGPEATHFESHTADSCPRIHPPDCALCHFLTAPWTPAEQVRFAVSLVAPRVAAPAVRALTHRVGRLSHPQPRAPPVLS